MKLVSFVVEGRASYGVVTGDAVADCGLTLGPAWPDLRSVLAASEGLDHLARAASAARTVDLAAVDLLPPIPNPSKIFCIGHNYEDHRVEMGRPKLAYPSVFLRFADSQVAHDHGAWIPAESTSIDYEGELAVVIGRGGRRIPRASALAHVAAYGCYNDISVRDWQKHGTQFTPGKNFPKTGAFGPWIVTADEIADPHELELTTRLNGAVMQHAFTNQLIFSIPDLIEYCSTFTPLSPGDLIISGTPGGVGVRRDPPVFMKAGDVVEVEIGSIATLRNTLVAEPV